MRKRMMAAMLVVMTTLSLTGCGKFTCDLCGREKSGKRYTEKVFSREVTICNDCYKGIEEFINAF